MERSLIEYSFQFIIRTLSIFLAGVYIKSVLGKVKDIYGFSVVLADYKVLPKILMPFAAVIVPSAELAVAASFLLGGHNLQLAGWVGAILQAGFALVMLTQINSVQPHGCGCFGLHSAEKITFRHVLLNGALFAAFAFVALFPDVSMI